MPHRILDDGDTGLVFRTKLNDNFAELFVLETTKVVVARQVALPIAVTTTPTTALLADVELYAENMTYNMLTGEYENIYAGLYKFDFFMLANWNNGVELLLSAWVDGAQVGVDVPVTGQGAGTNLPTAIPYYLVLPANGVVEIKLAVATGTASVEVINSSISLSLNITADHLPAP